MWEKIQRLADDLYSEFFLIAIVVIVFPIIGVSYLISGMPDPKNMENLEQMAQATRVVIGQSVMATTIPTVLLLIMAVFVTRKRRWKQEDQDKETHKLVNAIFEQNKLMIDKLNHLTPQTTEARDEETITESTT